MRLAVGNGMSSDVWRQFLDRFGDIKMCEFYGATEGNICFMNHTGKIGSVGRTNFFYKVNSAFSTGNTLRSTNSCLELKLLPCEHFFFNHSFEAEVSV